MKTPSPAQSSPPAPRVSVVIPAYNYACYLPHAINSVLSQEFKDFELIVVDDGSTDHTRELVARYGDQVRYIYQTNAGLPSARNTGIRAARGEFVAFLDADDEWKPPFLKSALACYDRLPPEFAIVAAYPELIDEHGVPWKRNRPAATPEREITVRDIIFQTQFAPSSVVARRAALEQCGLFNPTLRSSEDRDMWMRMALHFRVFLQGQALIRARKHSNNMSKNAPRMKTAIRSVLGNAWRNHFVPHSAICFWMRVFSAHFYQCAWLSYGEKRTAAATGNMLLSILLWPLFLDKNAFDQVLLFRARAIARFLIKPL